MGKEEKLTLAQKWPIRVPRPTYKRFPASVPLLTGQRILDTLFPIAKGGTAAVPGGFRATDHVPGPPRHGVGNELRTISTAAGQSHKNTTGGRLAGVDAQLNPLRGHAGFQ